MSGPDIFVSDTPPAASPATALPATPRAHPNRPERLPGSPSAHQRHSQSVTTFAPVDAEDDIFGAFDDDTVFVVNEVDGTIEVYDDTYASDEAALAVDVDDVENTSFYQADSISLGELLEAELSAIETQVFAALDAAPLTPRVSIPTDSPDYLDIAAANAVFDAVVATARSRRRFGRRDR